MSLPAGSRLPPVSAPVAAVVVTYNRRELMRGCLAALRAQMATPDLVVVVDNGSSDGTAELLAAEAKVPGLPLQVVRPARNLGGAGGFAAGMEAALKAGADWLWLMDDDSEPGLEALARLLDASDALAAARPASPPIGFLASRVLWKDGSPHRMNAPGNLSRRRPDGGAAGLEPVDYASFVSLLVSREAVLRCGLPIAEFFIGSDDVEFTWRLTRAGFGGWLVEASRVRHLTEHNAGMDVWHLEFAPADLEKWAIKTRNLVAVNRRRPWGWLREGLRVTLLPAVWTRQGLARPLRRRLARAAWEGLFWTYEPLIRYVGRGAE